MRENRAWSLNLGRWGHSHVRLHMFFLLFAVGTLYLGWLVAETGGQTGAPWIGVLSLSLLAASVGVHVLGHVYASAQLGLTIDSIVIGPLGEFGGEEPQTIPRNQLLIALAGPAANLLVVVLCLPALMLLGHNDTAGLLHPLSPVGLTDGSISLIALKLTAWMNWLLALVNLLPAFPFDGGRIARCVVLLAKPGISRHRAMETVTRIAKFTAIVLLVIAWLTATLEPTAMVPPWFALCVLAIVLFFSAQHEEARRPGPRPLMDEEDHPFGYDFSQGYTSLERSHEEMHFGAEDDAAALERWIDHRREVRRRRQEEIEAAEDALVDEILARVHQEGMNSLTNEERSLLQRASMRYRTREEQ